jgi:hypothetical protein
LNENSYHPDIFPYSSKDFTFEKKSIHRTLNKKCCSFEFIGLTAKKNDAQYDQQQKKMV